MKNKKSVLMTLSVSYDYSNEAVAGIAANGGVFMSGVELAAHLMPNEPKMP